jgi:polyisoprenoid-binding protein YceI
MKLCKLGFFLAVALMVSTASAQTFTFGKAKSAQQLATVESVTAVETFTGKTSKVGGIVKLDQTKRKVSGFLEIDPASLETGIGMRDEHLREPEWLDTARYPKIRFTVKSVKQLSQDDYQVKGDFSMRGVTKAVTAIVNARYLKASAATKKAGFAGDVLHIDAHLQVALSDYGIQISGPALGKVANTVNIRFIAFGTTK